MAAKAGGGNNNVPKVFSERAKAASEMAKAHLAQLQAAMQVRSAEEKAKLAKLKAGVGLASSQAQSRAAQLDQYAQARANAETQGPSVDELIADAQQSYPDASQPSASLAGSQPDISSMIAQGGAGAVQGGAAVQQATGGMGSAQPQGMAQQLQGQVNPYNIAVQQTQGTVPVDAGSITYFVPRTTTQTTITPNQLSPYELGRLLGARQRDVAAETEKTLKEQTMNWARAKRMVNMGLITPEQFMQIGLGVKDTLIQSGLPPQLLGLVDSRADAKQAEIQAEDFKALPELQKEMALLNTTTPGSYQHTQTLRRIEKLASKSESPFGPLLPIMLHPAIQKSNDKFLRTQKSAIGIQELENILVQPNYAGIRGVISGAVTESVEMAKDVVNMFGGSLGYQKALGDATAVLDQLQRNAIRDITDDKVLNAEKAAYSKIRGILTDSTQRGRADQLTWLLVLNIAPQYLDRSTVLGMQTVKDELFSFQGAKSVANSIARLRTMKAEINQDLKNIKAERDSFRKMGVELPEYDFSTYGSSLGGREKPVGQADLQDLLKMIQPQK